MLAAPNLSSRVLDYDALSKDQLAQLCNEHAAQVRELTRIKHGLMTYLVSILRHPDAFRVDAHGRGWVKKQAIVELEENTRFQADHSGPDEVLLKAFVSDYVLRADPWPAMTWRPRELR